jgi:hypothetical protein
VGILACCHFIFGQTAAPTEEQRFLQPIIINGQQTQGVMVVENGSVQTHACTSPQHYVTVDQSSSGWACFEPTTGMWLLHAQPPPQTTYVYQQPPVYVPAPPIPIYDYSTYGYYPYGYYPYIVGPRFGIGFGFGYRSPIIIGRSIAPFRQPRTFGGFRQPRAGIAFGRAGRR